MTMAVHWGKHFFSRGQGAGGRDGDAVVQGDPVLFLSSTKEHPQDLWLFWIRFLSLPGMMLCRYIYTFSGEWLNLGRVWHIFIPQDQGIFKKWGNSEIGGWMTYSFSDKCITIRPCWTKSHCYCCYYYCCCCCCCCCNRMQYMCVYIIYIYNRFILLGSQWFFQKRAPVMQDIQRQLPAESAKFKTVDKSGDRGVWEMALGLVTSASRDKTWQKHETSRETPWVLKRRSI